MKISLTRRNFLKSAGVTVSAGLLAGGKMADAMDPDPQEGEPVRVPLRIILVRTPQEASAIVAQLSAGVAFEKLAQEHSVDPSATNGGYLGRVRISTLQPEVREAIIHLYPGEASDVIETPSGYAIVEVLPEAVALEIENSEYEWKLAEVQHAKTQVVPLVDGFYVALDFFTREPKPPNWNQDLPMICQMHSHALTLGTQTIEAHLEESKSRNDLAGMVRDYEALAQLECYQTEMVKAIKHFQGEYQIAVSNKNRDAQHKLEEKLGIAYMFQGDIENLAKTVHIEGSLFPIRPEAKFKVTSNVETAVKQFLTFLQQKPSDLEVKWLLNIAYMKLGKYPDAVPRKHLIPPGAFKSKENIGRFVDVAPSLGLNVVGLAGSVIVDDFDNDGFLDIVMSDYGPCIPMRYFHNNGDGTFTDRSAESGLSKQLGGFNMVQADYNNDGWMDILVLRGAWELPMRKSLLRNNGDGTFTDVTQESGLAIPATMTQTAAWADFDNDGHIDLFVGNENSPSQLFHNRGDSTFVDVALPAGVGQIRATKAVTAGDYDNDGFPDFYVSNLDGENYLYHNNGDGTFTDVAKELHVELPLLSFPAWFFDYNNDGWLDLFVTSSYHSVIEIANGYLNLPLKGEGCKLYKNTGRGAFQDVSKQVGLDRSFMPMGANFGDIDNDGFLDLYLGTGAPSYGALVPNVLFRNHDGKYFVEITASSGTGSLEKGHGVAFADIDNDGQEELFSRLGGMTSGDKAATLVFRTPRNENNWITVHLVGVKTNRAAIGARIKVTVETADHNTRSVHRVVGSGGSFGASPLRQHIGLGRATRIESIEISWPTSKTLQTFRDVPLNQFIEIKEFAKSFTVQGRHSFPLPRH